ncbi:MAG TPA: helix-turn-helix domain-containing protein [Myxococcota bacterium]|nr:helix-turn-helix domain-containing protein [Myxococcota bacterium]
MTTTPTTPPQRARSRRPLRADDGRLVRGRKAKNRIREAALALFRERGFDGATLRAIGARAGMGASSIYRHVESKQELLIEELAARQEEAWRGFRKGDDRRSDARERLGRFLDLEHALLAQDADYTTIALRASTQPEARVARRVLALQDRTIGLVAEILQAGKVRGELARELDVLAASRVIVHVTTGARIPWANGLVSAEGCRASIAAALDVLFSGMCVR